MLPIDTEPHLGLSFRKRGSPHGSEAASHLAVASEQRESAEENRVPILFGSDNPFNDPEEFSNRPASLAAIRKGD